MGRFSITSISILCRNGIIRPGWILVRSIGLVASFLPQARKFSKLAYEVTICCSRVSVFLSVTSQRLTIIFVITKPYEYLEALFYDTEHLTSGLFFNPSRLETVLR